MNTSSASARSSSKVTVRSRREPLRLSSLRLRGAGPAERRAGMPRTKLSSPTAAVFLRGRLLNLVGFEPSTRNETCGLLSDRVAPDTDGAHSAVAERQETATVVVIFSSPHSTLWTARDFPPPEHSVATLRKAALVSS
ncbi:hypothetical protein RR46_11712 [Papilio xuthus]|uniref:Uncharacterized protein n=1 Tax=Papilio xuthus TaxID=66420 RepID=A0A194PTA9_PAPXU|nr:hypothetical protein RR46_11712 [Papilio xuthus]